MVAVRRGEAFDIAFIMQIERLPGMDRYIGRFDEATHLRQLVDPAWRYLIAEDNGRPIGFVILNDLDNRDGNTCIKRIAVKDPDVGLGSPLLREVIDRFFTETPVFRLWLNVVAYNTRARHVYAKLGFVEEGIKRQSALLPDETRADLVMMSMLRPEWETRR